MLLVLLAVLGVTILRIGQLIWLHLFLGLLLVGPVVLKTASTGYRLVRYYSRDPAYRRKGPPELGLRLLAPGVVVSTVVVFLSGVILLVQGPARRGPFVSIHKASFIVWLALTAVHVLGHLAGMPASLRAVRRTPGSSRGRSGSAGRWLALGTALLAGLVLALVLIPDFAPWTSRGALHHHHG